MKKTYLCLLALLLATVGGIFCPVKTLGAERAFYVENSGDGKMWTMVQELPLGTWENGRPLCWYEMGTRCLTGGKPTLRTLETGEHYYRYDRTGKVPVKEWRVTDPYAYCISVRTGMPGFGHGISSGSPDNCESEFFSGWMAFCADCGDAVLRGNVHMSYEAAKSMQAVDVNQGYYFKCPCMKPKDTGAGRASGKVSPYVKCGHLNRYWEAASHKCREISYNRYRVVYDANGKGAKGSMAPSYHMYHNAEYYEGKKVTPSRTLSLCTYDRTGEGYVFTGWNTMPDGRGVSYGDGAEIYDLTSENYQEGADVGTVTLYAQWERVQSTLEIDGAGGRYGGENPITRNWGTYWRPDGALLSPPPGYKANFQVNGGGSIPQVNGAMVFCGWELMKPANGELWEGIYKFTGKNQSVDRIRAVYAPVPITLPSPEKEGVSFGGWYLDRACTQLAGYGGEPYVLNKNVTFYAKWVDLKLTAMPDYAVNGGKGAVNLAWGQRDGVGKTYRIYRREEGQTEFQQIFFDGDEIKENMLNLSLGYEGRDKTIVIPSSGFYTLTAEGAQGGDWGSRQGGLGGKITGTFYLEKGEKICFTVGGKNGFNGGGQGTDFGNGGGRTLISSDRKGILLIAGGGGGATSSGDGLPGGEVSHVVLGDGNGHDGMAGGGGGCVGGRAGTRIVHVHSAKGGCYQDSSYDALSPDYAISPVSRQWKDEERDWEDSYIRSDYYFSNRIGGSGTFIPVNGNKVLRFGAWIYGEGANEIEENTFIQVADQNGRPFFTASVGGLRREWNQFETGVILPAGSGIYDGWPPVAKVTVRTDWSKSDPGKEEYDILEGYDTYYPIFYEDKTARAAKVTLNAAYGDPVFYGNYAHEYYPPTELWRSDILLRRGFGDRPLLFLERSHWFGMSGVHFQYEIHIPEGVTGISVYAEGVMDSLQYHLGEKNPRPVQKCKAYFDEIYLTGGLVLDCGAKDLDIPAGGGSHYVNREYALSFSAQEGVREGHGIALLKTELWGLTEAGNLDAVEAWDKAAPDAVDRQSIVMNGAGDNILSVEFGRAEDQGTKYFFKAESYSVMTGEKLCESNIAECVIKSGIKEYRYLIDSRKDVDLGALEGRTANVLSAENRRIETELHFGTEYLHLAAVDYAGNVSETVHIKLSGEHAEVAWEISTERVEIDSVVGEKDYGNVYPAGENAYYVRADGTSPFQLSFRSHMHGSARTDYQIDHQIFEFRTENLRQKYGAILPYSSLLSTEVLEASKFRQWAEGSSILTDGAYTGAVRRQGAKDVDYYRAFIMPVQCHGKSIMAIPVAGATYRKEVGYSDGTQDETNAIKLTGDGQGPVISGLERLTELELIDRHREDVTLKISAEDPCSGVRNFYLEIRNEENFLEETFFPDEEGIIRVDIAQDSPLFSGVFTVTAHASDNVGNETEVETQVMEFALSAEITRILPPHEPVFKQGESGILHIEAWGYAEKVEVEFPEFLSEYNRTFLYADRPRHKVEESIQFMIPLDAPEDVYEITVRAYKGDRFLEAHPAISTMEVEGSVLDELRTRLR